MSNTQVVVALGPSVFDNKLVQKKVSIDFLFKKFHEPKIRSKKDGPYFVFASFKDNQRNAHNVKFYYGATLDLDYGNITLKKVKKVMNKLKCRYCIYTTHSHQDVKNGKGNRYRIVVPYSAPISKEKHVETTIYLNYLFGDTDSVDTSAKALSRPMYLPACPKNRVKLFEFYDSGVKSLLNPEKKIEIPAHLKWQMEELNKADSEKVDMTREVVEGDGRNDHIAKLAGTLIQQGKTLQEIMEYCDEVNQLKFSPPMKSTELVRTVKSVWKSHTRNHDDKDWSYKQLLDRVQKTKSIEEDMDHLMESLAVSVSKGKTSALEADKLLNAIKKKDGNVTIGSLRSELKHKQKAANEDKKNAKEHLEYDEDLDSPVLDKVKKEYRDHFFVASQNVVYHRQYNLAYKVEAFNTQHSSLKQDFNGTQMSPFRILDEIGAIRKVDAIKYHPGRKKIDRDDNGMLCLNSYNPPLVKPAKGRIIRLIKHFKYLFPNDFERNVLLDYIAFNYQNPGEKIMWCPVIKGRKGIGKSLIANKILAPIFGPANVRSLNNSQPLLEKFNTWQTDSQIVVVHELFVSNRMDVKQLVTENIKSFITDEYLTVRKMHTDGFQTENVTNMIAFTNHEDSLYVTPDERRFCMIRCEVEPREAKYYDRLVKFLVANQEAIAYFFKKRKITTISPHVLPMTRYTQDVIGASLNWAEAILADAVDDDKSAFKEFDVMSWTSICHEVLCKMSERGDNIQKYDNIFNGASATGRILRQALLEAGFKAYDKSVGGPDRVRINGKLEKVWMTPRGKAKNVHKKRILLITREVTKAAEQLGSEYLKHLV